MSPFHLLPESDAALVRGALADDPRSCERLVRRYQRRAHAIARAAGVPDAAVEDAVQDAFLKAFRHLPGLRAPESFGPWFLNIVRNTGRDRVRGARRRPALELDEAVDIPDPRGPEGHDLESEELKDLLWRKVAELPESVREAIFLYYHDGESVRSVAKALGTSQAAILKRLERGRSLLRGRLWRSLEASIRETIPAEREWRRRGRQLTILLASAVTGSWGARAGAAAGTGSGLAGGGRIHDFVQLILGGMEMAGKKHAVALVLGAAILGSGIFLATGPLARRQRDAARSGTPAAETTAAPRRGAPAKPAGGEEALPAAAAREAAAPAAKPPALLGRITGTEGQPVEGARVLAIDLRRLAELTERSSRALGREGNLAHEVRAVARECRTIAAALPHAETNDAGEYRFADLPPGEYRLLAGHPEHLPRADGEAVVQGSGPARCDLELLPALRIAGRVRDEDGRPVAGAAIAAGPSRDRGLDAEERKERLVAALGEGRFILDPGRAASDPGGAFSLNSLEPAPHDLVVQKEGFAPARLHDVHAGSATVEIVLRRGLTLRGRVITNEKQPLEGAEVLLAADLPDKPRPSVVGEVVEQPSVPTPASLDAEDESRRATRSDTSGRFAFVGLVAGAFELKMIHEGFPALSVDVRLEDVPVDLGDLVVERPLAIRGRVVAPHGKPLAGARVWIEDRARGGLPGWGGRFASPSVLLSARTGGDGSFALEPLPPGVFTVRVSSRDFAPAAIDGVEPGGEGLEIPLQEGIAIRGRVTDGGDGSPVAGAAVAVGRGLWFEADPEKQTVTADGGEFTVRGLAPHAENNVVLRVSHPAYPGKPAEVRLDDTGDLYRPVEVQLHAPDRLAGRVVDAAGNTVAGARVRVEIPGWRRLHLLEALGPNAGGTLSGPDGSFAAEIPRTLRSPHYRIEVAAAHPAAGAGRSAVLAAPPEGKPWPEVEIVLLPASGLRGKVTRADGEPVVGAVVTARRGEPADPTGAYGGARSGITSALGVYAIRGLEPGVYDLEARAQGHAPRVERGVEVGTDPREQDFILAPGVGIDGRVVDTTGRAVEDAEVFAFATEPCDLSDDLPTRHRRDLRREQKGGLASARTDTSGRYRLAHLPEQDLTLVARAGGSCPSELLVVRPGESPDDLVVTRLATLSGVVADAETGRPVPAFHVHARVEGETTGRDARDLIPREFVEPSGSFFIEGLFPGRATVAVQARGYVPWVEDVLLEPGLDAGLRPRLGRGKTLRGQVVNRETDLPVAFVWVVCHPRGNARQVMTVPNSMEWTDEGGTFAISGLAPGKYWVDAYHPEYARRAAAGPQGETKVTIAEEGEPEPLRIAIVPAGGLKGRILNLEGSRSFDTRLELKTAGGEGSVAHWGRVEHDGTFRLTSVPPGTYEVRLKQTFFKVEPEAGQAFLPEDTVEKFTPLGEVEVQAGATAAFEARMP